MTERAHAVALGAKVSSAIRSFPAMPKAPSPRELAKPQVLTEGVRSKPLSVKMGYRKVRRLSCNPKFKIILPLMMRKANAERILNP